MAMTEQGLAALPVGNQPRVLLIDDDRALAEMLQAYFANYAVDLRAAYTGQDGLRAAREMQPDIILLDIHLPDISGFDVAKQLQQHPKTAYIPIIFLTEVRGREALLSGLRLGADDYITKPFDLHELRLRIRNTLESARRVHRFHPVTGLASPEVLQQALQERLQHRMPWALLGVFIENFDDLRQRYGILAANDALYAIGKLVHYVLRGVSTEDLAAHLSDVDFAFLTVPERLPRYQKRVREILEPKLPYFYAWEDWQQLPEDRRLRLHLCSLTHRDGHWEHAGEVLKHLERQRAEA